MSVGQGFVAPGRCATGREDVIMACRKSRIKAPVATWSFALIIASCIFSTAHAFGQRDVDLAMLINVARQVAVITVESSTAVAYPYDGTQKVCGYRNVGTAIQSSIGGPTEKITFATQSALRDRDTVLVTLGPAAAFGPTSDLIRFVPCEFTEEDLVEFPEAADAPFCLMSRQESEMFQACATSAGPLSVLVSDDVSIFDVLTPPLVAEPCISVNLYKFILPASLFANSLAMESHNFPNVCVPVRAVFEFITD